MVRKFVVLGCSDARYGDFVVNHWLKSLMNNIDLKVVDVVILNYGLTKEQKERILKKGAKIVDCKKDGHIVNLRYRDMLRFLERNKYKQVLSCDSGDIIFQKNIMDLFYKNPNKFKGIIENLQPPTLEYALAKKTFSEETKKMIIEILKGKDMINGGVIAAPNEKFKLLCKTMLKFIERMDTFGPDQIVLNYVFYKEGFIDLGRDYNYIPVTANGKLSVKNGVFYDRGRIISILHNAGNYSFFRIVKDFGYGREYNRTFSYFVYYLLRGIYKSISFYRNLKSKTS